jgi:hypothetical protein
MTCWARLPPQFAGDNRKTRACGGVAGDTEDANGTNTESEGMAIESEGTAESIQ